nr:unnamed protein product [Digitaria exilis]
MCVYRLGLELAGAERHEPILFRARTPRTQQPSDTRTERGKRRVGNSHREKVPHPVPALLPSPRENAVDRRRKTAKFLAAARTRRGTEDFAADWWVALVEKEGKEGGEERESQRGFIDCEAAASWKKTFQMFLLVGAPNWAAPEPRLSLKKKFEALSNPNPIHTKPQETAMAGGEGSSRSKSAKRKAEAMKEVVATDEATPVGETKEISRWRSAHGHEYPIEETEELTVWKAFYEVGFGMPTCDFFRLPRAKAGATSKRGEGSKRAAATDLSAPVPKRARTLPKPRQVSTARQPLSEEEIIHNIFNPASTPYAGSVPVVEENYPAGPVAVEQEPEEEFTLGEPEIPMRPTIMAPEAVVPEEPRRNPETTLPEVLSAAPATDPPEPVEAQVEDTIAEVLADIEQLAERHDQNNTEPPSNVGTSQTSEAVAVPETERSRGKQAEQSSQEQVIEEIPRAPRSTEAEEEIGNFRIGTFEYLLDAEENEEHIDRGLYHAERAVAYFKAVGEASRQKTEYIRNISLMHAKAECLQKELEREREDRRAQEVEDANMIRTLHLRSKELSVEKNDLKKKLATAKSELKEALKTLFAEHNVIKEQLRVAVQQRKDADVQLIQVIEQQKKTVKDLEDAREDNKHLSEELVQLRENLADKKTLDEKLEQTTRRMSELEEAMQQMKKSDEYLAEALKRIALLEKGANRPCGSAILPGSSEGHASKDHPKPEAEPIAEAIAQSLKL